MKKTIVSTIAMMTLNGLVSGQQQFTKAKFIVGSEARSGYIPISAQTLFNDSIGYGFDFETKPELISYGHSGKAGDNYITGDRPVYFSVNVAEGTYKVTLTLGDRKGVSITTVKAEQRRLMLLHEATASGALKKISFIVYIRKPQLATGGKVALKPREAGYIDWDDKLTLEFSDSKPCVDVIELEKVNNQVTIFLAGNSTVVDQPHEPWAAWGQQITSFFKPGVAIANHAESGLTLASFSAQHRFDKIMSIMRPGDYLFIEFGHNDQKEKDAEAGAFNGYMKRLKLFIQRVKEKGGIPVVVTSTARRSFNSEGKIVNTLGDFPAAARKVAAEENVALIDLNAMSAAFYEALGVDESKKAFVHYPANTFPNQGQALADDTHFNSYGAYELAKCVAEGIKANKLGIAKYLIPMPPFDPSHPDPVSGFHEPQSSFVEARKPDGN